MNHLGRLCGPHWRASFSLHGRARQWRIINTFFQTDLQECWIHWREWRAKPAALPIFETFLRHNDILILEVSDTNVLFLERFLLLPASPASLGLLVPIFLLQLPRSQPFPTIDFPPLSPGAAAPGCIVLLACKEAKLGVRAAASKMPAGQALGLQAAGLEGHEHGREAWQDSSAGQTGLQLPPVMEQWCEGLHPPPSWSSDVRPGVCEERRAHVPGGAYTWRLPSFLSSWPRAALPQSW